jgi:anti-sigma regulatory factor (Ser/Thr protein kinase)
MHRVWQIDGGDHQSALRARKEFAAYLVLIFSELLANALTHGRGSIQASIGPGEPYAILYVEDAGTGFALERVQQPVRGQLGGRGILIAKSLARSMYAAHVSAGRFRVTVELPVRLPA